MANENVGALVVDRRQAQGGDGPVIGDDVQSGQADEHGPSQAKRSVEDGRQQRAEDEPGDGYDRLLDALLGVDVGHQGAVGPLPTEVLRDRRLRRA